MQRQLIAIMFTDIVGYTAMMGSDEERALDMLRVNRKIHKNLIHGHHGIWVKEMGDGVMARYNSALDAVNCAIAIQSQVRTLDFKLRIGIHLADVTFENEDIFGDGVNVASRIQSEAVPGGIYISDSINTAIKSIGRINTAFIGKLELKNVLEPIPAYCIVDDGLAKPKTIARKNNDRVDSLAVLPFKSLSSDPEQQHIVDGMQDALIGELAQISSLRVISRTSTLRYRDTQLTMPEIATELGVKGLVEATVLQMEKVAHIQVQLIQAFPDEAHLWACSYNKDMRDIYALYGEVVKDITRNIHAKITDAENDRIEHPYVVAPEAYKAYLKGVFHWEKLSARGLQSSIKYFEQATRIDSNFAPAYSGIAGVWVGRMQMGISSPNIAIPNIYLNIEKTQELDHSIADTHFWQAIVGWVEWDWKKCLNKYDQALKLNPSHALAAAYQSHMLAIVEKFDDSIQHIEKAIHLDPFNPLIQALYAMQLNFVRDYDRAIEVSEAILDDTSNHPMALTTLRSAYHNKKMYQQAYSTFKESYLERGATHLVKALEKGHDEGGYHTALQKVAEELISISQRSFVRTWEIATLYARAGMNEKALEYLEKAYNLHDPNMPYINVDPIFDDVKENMRFQILLGKMKLISHRITPN